MHPSACPECEKSQISNPAIKNYQQSTGGSLSVSDPAGPDCPCPLFFLPSSTLPRPPFPLTSLFLMP